MAPRSAIRTLLGTVALATALGTFVAPAAATAWRCRMTDRTSSHPCCPEASKRTESSGFHALPCCAPVAQLAERAPVQTPSRVDGPDAPAVVAWDVSLDLLTGAPPATSVSWTRADFDSGPQILRRVCSLLI